MIKTTRRYTKEGYERRQFISVGPDEDPVGGSRDPMNDPYIATLIKPGDEWNYVSGTLVRCFTRDDNDDWFFKNHWDNIIGKPTVWTPEAHPIDPDEGGFHTGKLHVKHLRGLDFTHPTIQRTLAATMFVR